MVLSALERPSLSSHAPVAEPSSTAPALHYGRLMIDLPGMRVTVGDFDIPVTLSEFLLLTALAKQPYGVLDRPALTTVLTTSGVSRDPSPRAVNVHMSRLRRKLGEAGYDCIRTMRSVGYRFVPAM